jgi:hypothetical protein
LQEDRAANSSNMQGDMLQKGFQSARWMARHDENSSGAGLLPSLKGACYNRF